MEEDASPALEVRFIINPDYSGLASAEGAMDKATADLVRQAALVEKATGGMFKLAGVTGNIEAVGGAATREMANLTREKNNAERTGERLIRQLEREAQVFGKTRSEVRQMDAEIAALKAESAGLTDVADRLRAASAEMARLNSSGLQPIIPTGKLAGHHMQNLAFQFQDLGIQMYAAAGSSAPFKMAITALLQQGAQINGIMGQAQIGIGGVARAFGAMLVPFLPVIAALGAGAAAFGLFSRSVSQGVDTEKMIAGLGLTKDEIEKLKNTSVTTGDVVKATFQVMAERVGFSLGDLTKWFSEAMDFLTRVGRITLAGLYAMFAGQFRAIAAIVKGVFAGKGIGEIVSDVGNAYKDSFNEANGALKRFGADVTKQIASNKLADLKKQADKLKEDRPDKKGDGRAERLAREAQATEAQIRNLYALADAYDASGAAALIAEARVKAESAAIKKQGDIEAAVAQQIRLSIAQRVSDAAKGAAAVRDQARIQAEINAAIAAGEVPAERANELLRERMAELPLLAAIEAAQQSGLTAEVVRATKALEDQRSASLDAKAAAAGLFFTTASADADRRIATLEEERRLIGATNLERVRALAILKATQDLQANDKALGTEYANKYIADAVRVAETTERNAVAQRNYNLELSYAADTWDLIAKNVQDAARGMADAFGSVGRAIGDVASIYAGYQADRARLDQQHKAAVDAAGTDEKAIARENAKFALATSTRQIGLYGDMATAAKGFFKTGSAGYKALETAEKAFRAIEFALSIKAMAQDAIETGSSIAKSGARAAANAVEAVAKAIASLPFPLNLAAGAATAAALASIGIAIGGAFGGGGKNNLEKANDGKGTVLGDKDAQSESIKRSMDLLRDVDTLMLTESRRMAASLRSIDQQIGGLATILVRSGNINADSRVAQGFKPNAIGSVLGSIPLIGGILGGLFGTKTKVIGSGIYGGAMSLDAILAGAGYDAQTYSDVEKKKKFFGLTTSKKFSTVYGGAVDSSVSDQFGLILRSFNDAILAAAGPLGNATDEIKSRLSGFVFSLGKIDLTGLSGTEIQEKLAAVFGAAADNMAEAAFPGISRFQKVGEGAFETLVRVSSTVEAVSTTLDSLGKAAIGLSIDAKVALANQFDTIGDFTSAAQSYFDSFYTKEEQATARAAQLTRVFGSMNMVMPRTLTGFRQLVDAQDLTTDAGRAAYATLLQLAPAFSDLMGSLGGAKTAADAAEDLREAWKSIGDSIADEVKRIRGLANSGTSANFASLQGQFNAATAGARGGDQAMAKMLPQLSQDLLAAAERQATSRQELDRIRALTAASLEQTNASIISRTNALTLDELLDRTATAQAASTRQAANDVVDATNDQTVALREELAGMREDLTSVLASIAGNTDKTASILRDVTPDGDSLAIRTG